VKALNDIAARAWSALRAILGDDAYERYLRHVSLRHPGVLPLTRAEFQQSELERRWSQVNRCC
jgi:uncharacterized short protein YbdD (DUF466 family)